MNKCCLIFVELNPKKILYKDARFYYTFSSLICTVNIQSFSARYSVNSMTKKDVIRQASGNSELQMEFLPYFLKLRVYDPYPMMNGL